MDSYTQMRLAEINRELDKQIKKSTEPKKASVIGRSVVGGIVAGPLGAVVGAISAADKNNRNKK